uniref:Uncharacterized protein n=1 Tax=Arundo donax TaxID=35708 RepID=A0A0A8Y0D9_ARUDO
MRTIISSRSTQPLSSFFFVSFLRPGLFLLLVPRLFQQKLLCHPIAEWNIKPGICCDIDGTSVAWSSSLHSLIS